jgi:RimJ/RimL family protein N-acetyltransferase
MDIATQLFEGKLICLAPIDHDKDPEIESKWMHDPEYLRMLWTKPARPLSPAQVKKAYEAIEKEMDEGKSTFYFTIRMREDDRLVGFIRIYWIEWTNGNGWLELGIGDPNDRRHGYGSEALSLALRYAFAEINLYRLSAMVPEYNLAAMHLFTKAGFVEEVRRREALQRAGRYWDAIHLGLLREEWEAQVKGK